MTRQISADTESIEVHSVCILDLFGVIAVLSGFSSRAQSFRGRKFWLRDSYGGREWKGRD